MTDKETTTPKAKETKLVSKNLFNFLVAASIVLLMATVALGIAYYNSANHKVVAVVDNTEITQDEHYKEMKKTAGETSLNALIEKVLVNNALEKENIQVTKEEIDAEKQTVVAQFPSQDEFKAALETNGLTEKGLEEDIARYLKIDKMMSERIEITDEELKQKFDSDPSLSKVEAQVEANHILVATKEEADTIKSKLAQGEKFSDLAKEYSIDEQNADKGGSLGTFGRGTMEKAFEDAAFGMTTPGQISEPVKTSFGFHIIELVNTTPEKTLTFEEVKEKMREELLTEKTNEEYGKWIAELKEKAEIKGDK